MVESEEERPGDTGDSRTLRPNLHRFKSKVLLDTARAKNNARTLPGRPEVFCFVLTT
jgi:hypothetical protein